MSRVTYKDNRIIPAPVVNISKDYQKTGDGTIIGKSYSITLTGTLVAYKGSPTSSGTFHTGTGYPADETVAGDSRLSSVQRKQEALRELFSDEGYSLKIQALDDTSAVICQPRVTNINFTEGTWYDRSDYTITLEADELYGGADAEEDTFTEYISSASEDWSIDTNEAFAEDQYIPRTYVFTHNVSAVGKKFYTDVGSGILELPAWQQARDFVIPRLGFDSTIALSSGVNSLPSYYNGFNHVRNEQVDELGGSFAVTETWVLASGSATEDFTINTSASKEGQYDIVSIDGNIQGFEERDGDMNLTTSKWDNADTKFTAASGMALTRAQTFSGLTLNIIPLNVTIGRNPVAGTISYGYEYDNRPIAMISGSKSEAITVNDTFDGQMFASIFVLGRTAGPVLQDLSTKPANTRNLNISLVMPSPTYSDRTIATLRDIFINQNPRRNPTYSGYIQNIIDAVNPSGTGFSTVYQGQPQESWIPKEGSYSYNVEWTYE